MELGMQTIAQRKAARRSSLLQNDPPQAIAQNEIRPQAAPEEIIIEKTPEPRTSAIEPSMATAPSKPRIKALSTAGTAFNKETLLAMAKTMGLELTAAKKIWIKHSFSITPETKECFQKRCNALGFKMQDAMEEALQDWFKKHEDEYQAITEARNK